MQHKLDKLWIPQTEKLVNIITYINLRKRELSVEFTGELDVFRIIDVVKELAAFAPMATHQIVGSTSTCQIMCIKNMSIFESIVLSEGINKLKKYIDKISPQKVSVTFADFCNKNFPDFVITANNTARPTLTIEISSVSGNSRYHTKGIGETAFDSIRKFYSNNISLHT